MFYSEGGDAFGWFRARYCVKGEDHSGEDTLGSDLSRVQVRSIAPTVIDRKSGGNGALAYVQYSLVVSLSRKN